MNNGRSLGFDAYLLTLPADERISIEQAEKEYRPEWQRLLAAEEALFADSMKGLSENFAGDA